MTTVRKILRDNDGQLIGLEVPERDAPTASELAIAAAGVQVGQLRAENEQLHQRLAESQRAELAAKAEAANVRREAIAAIGQLTEQIEQAGNDRTRQMREAKAAMALISVQAHELIDALKRSTQRVAEAQRDTRNSYRIGWADGASHIAEQHGEQIASVRWPIEPEGTAA